MERISDNKFKFKGEHYKSGLVLKRLAPKSLSKASSPTNIVPFTLAIFRWSSFAPMLRQNAQDSIKVDQRVQVVSGGLVGHVIEIKFIRARVCPEDDLDTPPVLVPLCELVPVYRTGDNVKFRWSGSNGIVQLVNESDNLLTYVEGISHAEVGSIYISDDALMCCLSRSQCPWTPLSQTILRSTSFISNPGRGWTSVIHRSQTSQRREGMSLTS